MDAVLCDATLRGEFEFADVARRGVSRFGTRLDFARFSFLLFYSLRNGSGTARYISLQYTVTIQGTNEQTSERTSKRCMPQAIRICIMPPPQPERCSCIHRAFASSSILALSVCLSVCPSGRYVGRYKVPLLTKFSEDVLSALVLMFPIKKRRGRA